ncbi:cyclic nucleotide-binding domain-containing protein [Desulfoprunum benzoelyticum]|uniref:CRP-like cAMP-binding protein n=1 Tax=Desulfoprunum benzoelyticum TaxID=1506996 RepID=A0A840UQ82_9BACT|nr:cyclic nucleotide-binding domain-containing protein [Desulfoprunum benzoelyticum]MBB5347805.1 CRP-like cAMP-binding protein [Desulfoprunum benzoelyticum]MBM9531671.1 cyclic nucleotide-binding domain-containing protein [Desulfoprunum benzoelyticum]
MKEPDKQREALETLKAFNNAIMTVRLYPPHAPQINNAVERGYKALKQFVRQHGDLVISVQEKKPVLCGEPIPDPVLQTITNLVVYRHLEVIGVDFLVLKSKIDRHVFSQILSMFTSSVDKIKREGGGREFARTLKLDEYFPEEYRFAEEVEEAEVDRTLIASARQDYMDCLLGREQGRPVIDDLRAELGNPQQAAATVAAAVATLVLDLRRHRKFAVTAAFTKMLETAGGLIDKNNEQATAVQAADLLCHGLDDTSLALVMVQSFPQGFGAMLFEALLGRIDTELFGKIIDRLRRQESTLRRAGDKDRGGRGLLAATLGRLLDTGKGRHFLGLEKAKKIMEAGERERQAKRIGTGLQALLKGDLRGLQNDELVMGIPPAIQQWIGDGKDQQAVALLTLLNQQFREGDDAMQARLIQSLAIVGDTLVAEKRWDLLAKIIEAVLLWFRRSDTADFVYEKIAALLHAFMEQAWRRGNITAGDRILETFFQIRAGIIEKSPAVQVLVGRIQDREIDRSALPEQLQEYLDDPFNEQRGRRLSMQGAVVGRFLVHALLDSDKTDDRLRIFNLLTSTGKILLPILRELLPEPMPWHGKRNLIKLLAGTGEEQDVDLVTPYLFHEDLRVQREAFDCLYRISGDRKKEVLLRVASEAGELLRPDAVKALIFFCDEEVAAVLGELLSEHEHFSDTIRDALLTDVCKVLGRCPYSPAVMALQGFLQLKGKRAGRKIGPAVWAAAEEASAQLEAAQREEEKRQLREARLRMHRSRQDGRSGDHAPSGSHDITGLPEERAVRTVLAQGQKETARRMMLDLVFRTARMGNFGQAERLREWLIETDPTALGDIVKSAEIIEEEKKAAVDRGHLDVWKNLYQILTPEEFSTLYHCLEHRRFDDDEIIVSQGTHQTALFFINSGKVKIFFRDGDSDIEVKTMVSGEILGAGVFFDASVWTVSAVSVGQADISILTLRDLLRWHEEYPALKSKLNDFCHKFEDIDRFFRLSDKDRRKDRRISVSGRISIDFLDLLGNSTGQQVNGELFDISAGGVSFFLRLSRKELSRSLIGTSIRIVLPAREIGDAVASCQGVVLAVKGYRLLDNEYSVHVKFDEPISDDRMQLFIRQSRDGEGAGRPTST